jgi:5-methylcytosine-specific restriction protein A
MTRAVKEWIGRTDDTPVPPRVRTRVFKKFNDICCECDLPITGKRWICDHRKAIINGGENRETNLGPIHETCDKTKTAADVGEKSKVYRKTAKDIGVKLRKGRPMLGTRDSGIKRPFFGPVINRRTGKPFSSRRTVERQT